MIFLTERKRKVMRVLVDGPHDLPTIEARTGISSFLARQDLRDLRSEQAVRQNITRTEALWELTSQGRRELLRDAQLKLQEVV